MVNIDIALDIPPHTGAPANFIYELPNQIGARQKTDGNVELCSIYGISFPYILLDHCYVNGIEITKAYVEALNEIQCISNKLSSFLTVIGNESFEIIAANYMLPGMNLIGDKGIYANPKHFYRAFLENGYCFALVKKAFLSNGFRFKALGNWYRIANDITTMEKTQPDHLYDQERVFGFAIDSANGIFPINEAGTIY